MDGANPIGFPPNTWERVFLEATGCLMSLYIMEFARNEVNANIHVNNHVNGRWGWDWDWEWEME